MRGRSCAAHWGLQESTLLLGRVKRTARAGDDFTFGGSGHRGTMWRAVRTLLPGGPPVRYVTVIAALFCLALLSTYAVDKDEDTPAAAKTRKLLKEKVTVMFKDARLEDVLDELKDQVKGLKMQLDTKGGVSRNQTINYSGTDVALEEALDQMFKKNDLGYIVISRRNNAYDGSIQIRKGKERGYPLNKDDK
jgi:hypothetical protein